MQRRVETELADSDAALFVLNGQEGAGPGDRFIAAGARRRVACRWSIAVNKVDRLTPAQLLELIGEAAELGVGDDIFPISARTGEGVEALAEHLRTLLPESPFFFPAEDSSDQSDAVLLAELVREQVLRRTFQEVPHAVEVIVEDIERPREDLTVVHARLWVEAESQKGILIGSGGRMIKQIGTAARRELERELGTRVHLDLAVRVRRDWRARRPPAGPARDRVARRSLRSGALSRQALRQLACERGDLARADAAAAEVRQRHDRRARAAAKAPQLTGLEPRALAPRPQRAGDGHRQRPVDRSRSAAVSGSRTTALAMIAAGGCPKRALSSSSSSSVSFTGVSSSVATATIALAPLSSSAAATARACVATGPTRAISA